MGNTGRQVYERRLHGSLWTEAAAGTGLDIRDAIESARVYAQEAGLPWPPDRRTTGRVAAADIDIQELRRCVRETFKIRESEE